jgi:quinol monooxygenase YgiN
MSLIVIAEMTAKPGKEEELQAELLKLVEATRKEDGCLQYDLHAAVDNPRGFVFIENWTSREALEKHFQSPHIADFRKVQGELREAPRVTMYRRIS